jgi:hypothetical protein
VQRQLTLKVPLTARDFRSIQTPTDLYLDSLCTKAKRLLDGLPHCSSKCDAFLELGGNLFRLQLGI